mgnify:CR=1 FL=1
MNKVKPISPDEVKKGDIPDFVFEAFNEMIQEKWNGASSRVYQNEIIELILKKTTIIDRRDIFENNWLDVEDYYREAGWVVAFDKPNYNEDYKAFFLFRKK